MALTSTTLAAAVEAKAQKIQLTSATGLLVGQMIKINDEFVTVLNIDNTPTIVVERGQHKTLARDHGILSIAVYGYAYDFTVQAPPYHIYTYGASGALTKEAGLHRLAKATAGAYTLAAPTTDEEGLTMLLLTTTAAAHTVTLDSGSFNNETHSEVLVFAAAIGNCIEIKVIGGYWVVTLNKNITLPSTSASVSGSLSASVSASVSGSRSASVSGSISGSVSASST
jgi:hypothetical protein